MIRHIVMWNIEDGVNGRTKEENGLLFKEKIEALKSTIAEIVEIEVALDILHTDQSRDMVLVGDFKSLEDLKTYAGHKDHLEVVAFGKEFLRDRVVCDYDF